MSLFVSSTFQLHLHADDKKVNLSVCYFCLAGKPIFHRTRLGWSLSLKGVRKALKVKYICITYILVDFYLFQSLEVIP